MTDRRVDNDDVIVAMIALAEMNIPPDVQELLVQGNPERDVPPGALRRALVAVCERQGPRSDQG